MIFIANLIDATRNPLFQAGAFVGFFIGFIVCAVIAHVADRSDGGY